MPRRPIRYEMQGDSTDLQRAADSAVRSMEGMERQAHQTDRALDMEGRVRINDTALDLLRNKLLATRAQIENDIRMGVDVDAGVALAQLRRVESQLRQVDRMEAHAEVKVEVDQDDSFKKFFKTLGEIPGVPGGGGGMFIALGQLPKISPQLTAAAAGVATIVAGLTMPIIAGTVGGVVAGVGIKGSLSLLEQYDTWEKLTNKIRIVFDESEADIRDWAESVSANVGLGTMDVLREAAAIQDLLVPRGFSRSDAAAVTRAFYERGAALAEFSGEETAVGIDAINSALTGQRRALKGLGVDITATEVKERSLALKKQGWVEIELANGEKVRQSVEGYSDKMLESVATIDLIEDKSTDAWTAFTTGAMTADDVLDTLNATWANVKTELVSGLGGIFVQLVEDVLLLNDSFEDLGSASDSVARYIEENAEQIRGFMLDLALFALKGANSFIAMGEYIIEAIIAITPYVSTTLRTVGALAAALQAAAGAAAILAGQWDLGRQMITTADDTYRLADAAAKAGENFAENLGPDMLAGLGSAGDVVDGLISDVERIQNLDAANIAMRVSIDNGDLAAAERTLDYLSEDEIAVIKAKIDPESTDATDIALNGLLDERIAVIKAEAQTNKAEAQLGYVVDAEWGVLIPAAVPNYNRIEGDLDYLSRDRTATITVKERNITGGYAMGSGRSATGTRAIRVPDLTRAGVSSSGNTTGVGSDGAWYGPPQVIIQGTVLDPDGTARALEEVLGNYYGRTGRRG